MPRNTAPTAAPTRPRLPRTAAPAPGSLNVIKFQRAQEAVARQRALKEAKRRKQPGPRCIVHVNELGSQNGKKLSAKAVKKGILKKTKSGRVGRKKNKNKKALVPERGQITKRLTRSDKLSSSEFRKLPISTRRHNVEQEVTLPEPSEDKDEMALNEDKGQVKVRPRGYGGVVGHDEDNDGDRSDSDSDSDDVWY